MITKNFNSYKIEKQKFLKNKTTIETHNELNPKLWENEKLNNNVRKKFISK